MKYQSAGPGFGPLQEENSAGVQDNENDGYDEENPLRQVSVKHLIELSHV